MNEDQKQALLSGIRTDLYTMRTYLQDGIPRQLTAHTLNAGLQETLLEPPRAVLGPLDLAESTINEFAASPTNDSALRAMTAVAAVDAQLSVSNAQLSLAFISPGQAISAAGSAISSSISHLKTIIQGVSTKLWTLISHLLKVTSWALTGQLGVTLGIFQGNVQLQITFS